MTLYLLRHGVAEAAAPGQPDAARALTAAGVHQMQLQAAFLKRAGLHVDRLFASPYRRAQQTAALVAPALGVAAEEEPLLQCGCSFDDAVALLERAAPAGGILLVGHQPDLGSIVRTFTGSTVSVRTGTLVVLDVRHLRPYGATLAGLYDPDLMAQVGHALSPAGTG